MTLYRSLTTGQTLTREDLIDCETCEQVDSTDCPTCGGPGLLEGYGIPPGDNMAPRRVVAIEEEVVHG